MALSIEKSKNVVKEYRELLENIEGILTSSGLKVNHLAEKAGMSSATFYRKRKNLSFSVNEVSKLLEVCSRSA